MNKQKKKFLRSRGPTPSKYDQGSRANTGRTTAKRGTVKSFEEISSSTYTFARWRQSSGTGTFKVVATQVSFPCVNVFIT